MLQDDSDDHGPMLRLNIQQNHVKTIYVELDYLASSYLVLKHPM